MPVTVAGADGQAALQVGRVVAEGLHQVDSPAFDAHGRLHVTYSGTRGQQVPVSVFRIDRDGSRDSLVAGLVNPTALAFGPDGQLYVSSRFEGVVYKVDASGHYEAAVSDVSLPLKNADSTIKRMIARRMSAVTRDIGAGSAPCTSCVCTSGGRRKRIHNICRKIDG